jgi:drug/metabolite transporter (DMT)-like permease
MTSVSRGIALTLVASLTAAGFLTTFKMAAALAPTADVVLVMLTSAAVFNTVTSVVQHPGRELFRLNRVSVVLAAALATLTLLGNHGAAEAVSRISAPLTSVMQQTQVLFVAVLGAFILGEIVSVRFWIGSGIAGAGLWLLHAAPVRTADIDPIGTLMAIGSALCFGLMSVLTRKYIFQIRPVSVNALRLWLSIGLWFLVERRLPVLGPDGHRMVLLAAAAALFGPFLSRIALMYALKYIPPSHTTLLGLTTPVVTLGIAFVVFGTVPSAREATGGLIMLAGIALPLLEQRAHARAVPEAAE